MSVSGSILDEDTAIDIPGYGEAISDPVRLPPYTEDLGGGITREVDADGTEYWYQNGRLHRDGDLPAVINIAGDRAWYRDGKLHRDGDLPAVVFVDGERQWHQDGMLHRGEDKPAITRPDGTEEYRIDGKRVPKP